MQWDRALSVSPFARIKNELLLGGLACQLENLQVTLRQKAPTFYPLLFLLLLDLSPFGQFVLLQPNCRAI